ncbi:hypothetical protein ES702_02316 [subsurface metagenome]
MNEIKIALLSLFEFILKLIPTNPLILFIEVAIILGICYFVSKFIKKLKGKAKEDKC